MCFSNLPVEFDENGDPYLAEEADDVEDVTSGIDTETPLTDDPEGAYAAILADIPQSVRRTMPEDAGIDSDEYGEPAEGD